MSIEVISLAVVLLVLIAVGILIVVVIRGRSRAGDPDLSGALLGIQTQLAGRDGALGARVSELDSKLVSLQEVVTSREASLDEQVRGMGAQMQGIANLFTNDRARGAWGEISMLRIFELGGLVEGRDYTAQFHSGEGTPDAVVHLPDDRNIVIESKFPVVRYSEALAAKDADERKGLLVQQGKELERVAKDARRQGLRRHRLRWICSSCTCRHRRCTRRPPKPTPRSSTGCWRRGSLLPGRHLCSPC